MFRNMSKEQLREMYEHTYSLNNDINSSLASIDFYKEIAKRYFDESVNRFSINVNVDYDKQELCYLYEVETTDDLKTVYGNIVRCVELLNHYDWNDDWESFEEFKIFTNDVTKHEFDTMLKCFDGYNELTFVAFCKEMYGYDLKMSVTSISVTIE